MSPLLQALDGKTLCEAEIKNPAALSSSLLYNFLYTVPLDLNFTYAHVQKATARSIHGNAPE